MLLLLTVHACTWVNSSDLDQQLAHVDDDADGFDVREDCDDSAPDINPGTPEVWYDGIDQDCAGDEDFDQDHDGRVPDEHQGKPTSGLDGSGGLPGGDCYDLPEGPVSGGPGGEEMYAGASDDWYDGVDADCAEDDDYDQDGDGFVQTIHEGLATLPTGTSDLPGGDCDDTEIDVNPLVPEVWYDDVDANCDAIDDFDRDGDGYADPSGFNLSDLPPTDCNDDPANADGGANAHPTAPDVWYDGFDTDCAGNDDWDKDGDGYVRDADVGSSTEFLSKGKGGDLPGDDCNDEDASQNPSMIEVIGDDVDQDCDDGAEADSFRVTVPEGLLWTDVGSIEFGENATVLFASIVAEAFDPGGAPDEEEVNDAEVVFEIDPLDPLGGFLYVNTDIVGSGADIADMTLEGHGFHATDEYLFSAIGYTYGVGLRTLVVGGYRLDTEDAATLGNTQTDATAPFTDVGLEVDADGNLHSFACVAAPDDQVQYVRNTPANLLAGNGTNINEVFTGLTTGVCQPAIRNSDGSGSLLFLDGTLLTEATFDPDDLDPDATDLSLGSQQTFSGTTVDFDVLAGTSEPWVVAARTGSQVMFYDVEGVGSTVTVNLPSSPLKVYGMVQPGKTEDTAYVTWIDALGSVGLLYGPLGGLPACFTVVHDLEVPFVAEYAAVWAPAGNPGTIVVGVTGANQMALGMAQVEPACP